MSMKTLQDLFIDEVRDVYDAEHQLTKALPKMAKAAANEELKAAFEEHLQQTEGHITRLESVFELVDRKPTRKTCKAMKGLVEEGSEVIEEDGDEAVKDAALIGAAQRVEHYEIAAYGTLRTFAETLGIQKAVDLLQQTLDEEKQTDENLTALASTINFEATT
jgi:ferritin-like metal-binding protein YciE